jgi:TonB-linked SusC/RagA family outer membrane protein
MKKIEFEIFPYLGKKQNFLLIMKLTFLLTVVCFLQTSATVYSQATKFSFEMKNQRILDVLREIEKSSDFRFFYQREQVDVERKVNLNITDKTVEEILPELFTGQKVVFDVRQDNLILIKPEQEAIESSTEYYAQQQKSVSGKVTDTGNQPLPGVTIVIKGTTQGTVTNADGDYSIRNIPSDATLEFSFVGMKTQALVVGSQNNIDVTMEAETFGIEEVVTIGYGTRRKKDIVGSVSVVNMEALKSIPTGSAIKALQGNASGVTVVNSGAPGSQSQITIRGMTSFGNNNPLVLVDGVEGNLNLINATDIEELQVLKDAGSAAIYGVRGANGVIIVTTKKAKTGITTVSYDGYVGVTVPPSGNPLNLANSDEWWKLMSMGFPNDPNFKTPLPDYMFRGPGIPARFAFEGDPAVDPSKYIFDSAKPTNNYIIAKINKSGTDWFHEIFKPAMQNNHTITISGGTDKLKALLSLNYLNEQGNQIETFQKRYSARVNTDYTIGKNIRIGENLTIYTTSRDIPSFGDVSRENITSRIFMISPIQPVYDISGIKYNGAFTSPTTQNQYNPVFLQKQQYADRNNNWAIQGNVFAEIDFLKHFTLHSSFGGSFNNNYVVNFTPVDYTSATAYAGVNSLSENSGYSIYSIFTNTLVYKNTFGNHKIDVLAGSEAIEYNGRSLNGSRSDFYLSDFTYLILGNGKSDINNSSSAYKNTLYSLFGRLDYSYKDRYLLAATIRRDGSSKFGENSRYGLFPSLSAGWRLSGESFMKDISWINDLKLRLSYGELGSQTNVDNANAYSVFGSSAGGSYYSINGNPTQTQQGFFPSRYGNTNTGWESNIIYNVGIDATILDRIELSAELYQKNIGGLLFPQPLPNTAGGATPPNINIGDVENRGFDFSAIYRDRLSDELDFTIGANITHYVNEIVSIPGTSPFFDVGDVTNSGLGSYVRNQVGHSIGQFYGYQVERLFQSAEDVAASPTQSSAAPGRFKYKDINGSLYEDGKPDGKIDALDRTFIGSPHPKFTYGINLGMNYKNFDFATVLYGSYGNEVINIAKNMTYFSNFKWQLNRDLLNQWSPTNTSSNIPVYTGPSTFSSGSVVSSFYIEDGSYLKCTTLELGYSLPAGLLNKIKLNQCRIYAQLTNLFLITKYTGLDPEVPAQSTSALGVDAGHYPNNPRGYYVGMNIKF